MTKIQTRYSMKMLWIFGYGSIMWKVDFPYEIKIVGYIEGYLRRFYQYSTDHRGTPEKPGRVVTLIPTGNPKDRVWGVAYGVHPDKAKDVIEYLDHRERGGYTQNFCKFYPKGSVGETIDVMFYLATTTNNNWAGETDIDSIVKQIATANGPSGPNIDYVLALAKRMREIAPDVNDEHLFAVEQGLLNYT